MKHCDNSVLPDIYIKETDSTNNYLHKISKDNFLKEFTTVVAGYQTSGKGQRGNSWESQKDKNLLFSILFYPDFLEIRKQFMLSKVIALSIKKSLDRYTGDISIKWPNDIYWQDKKICGTLIENEILGFKITKSIAGIGLNINQESFHSTAPNPVSLINITQQIHSKQSILQTIQEYIVHYYNQLKAGREEEINRLYHLALYRREGFYWYKDNKGEFEARILEVLPDGILILEDKTGNIKKYAFKEVLYVFSRTNLNDT